MRAIWHVVQCWYFVAGSVEVGQLPSSRCQARKGQTASRQRQAAHGSGKWQRHCCSAIPPKHVAVELVIAKPRCRENARTLDVALSSAPNHDTSAHHLPKSRSPMHAPLHQKSGTERAAVRYGPHQELRARRGGATVSVQVARRPVRRRACCRGPGRARGRIVEATRAPSRAAALCGKCHAMLPQAVQKSCNACRHMSCRHAAVGNAREWLSSHAICMPQGIGWILSHASPS